MLTWALLTGFVTGLVAGGIWVGGFLSRRQHRLGEHELELLEDANRRLLELDDAYRRLADAEDRIAFAERLLSERSQPRPLEPPGT